MNPFQRLGKRIADWWHGNITNGGIMSLNSSDFFGSDGIKKKRETDIRSNIFHVP